MYVQKEIYAKTTIYTIGWLLYKNRVPCKMHELRDMLLFE